MRLGRHVIYFLFVLAIFTISGLLIIGIKPEIQLNDSAASKEASTKKEALKALLPYLNVPLMNIDKQLLSVCQDLENTELFRYKGTRYWVLADKSFLYLEYEMTSQDELAIATKDNQVFFSPAMLTSPRFRAVCAHELGHIQNRSKSEKAADRFAAKLVGQKAVIEMLDYYDKQPSGCLDCEKRIHALLETKN